MCNFYGIDWNAIFISIKLSKNYLSITKFQVIWDLLYDTSSTGDIGTLYQARTFLNARSVPSKPMKDVNACEELLLKYSEALIIAAFEDVLQTENLDIKDQK